MAKLFFFGDSITAGAWDSQGGWVNRFIGQIMKKSIAPELADDSFYCMPYNMGVAGDTAPDIVRRLSAEVKTRTYNDSPDQSVQFVFAIGVNDSVQYAHDLSNVYTDEEFQLDLEVIIEKARHHTNNISFIGLLPVDEDITMPMKWEPTKGYSNKSVQHFNKMIADKCAQHDLPFLNLYDAWLKMDDYKSYLSDGLHPNDKGHSLMTQQISRFLLNEAFDKFHS